MSNESPDETALRLLDHMPTGALASLTADGYPMASLVAFARADDGAPLFLISDLALHTKNLTGNPRASLLVREERSGDPLALARVTFIGSVARLTDAQTVIDARTRFRARHPQAATYIDFPDFHFHALKIKRAHLVAGFGRIVEIPGRIFMR